MLTGIFAGCGKKEETPANTVSVYYINKEETKSDYKADIVIHDKLGNVFKKIKDAITNL